MSGMTPGSIAPSIYELTGVFWRPILTQDEMVLRPWATVNVCVRWYNRLKS